MMPIQLLVYLDKLDFFLCILYYPSFVHYIIFEVRNVYNIIQIYGDDILHW